MLLTLALAFLLPLFLRLLTPLLLGQGSFTLIELMSVVLSELRRRFPIRIDFSLNVKVLLTLGRSMPLVSLRTFPILLAKLAIFFPT